jgi:hypothetical protein
MYPPRETVIGRIARLLRTHTEDTAQERLPKRVVELILELDEQERRRSEPTSSDAPVQPQEK